MFNRLLDTAPSRAPNGFLDTQLASHRGLPSGPRGKDPGSQVTSEAFGFQCLQHPPSLHPVPGTRTYRASGTTGARAYLASSYTWDAVYPIPGWTRVYPGTGYTRDPGVLGSGIYPTGL